MHVVPPEQLNPGSHFGRRQGSLLQCLRLVAWFVMLVGTSTPARAHEELDRQIAEITERIRRSPKDPTLLLHRAELHRQHGDPDAALADLAQARKLDSQLADVDFAEGRTLLDADRLVEARSALDRFLTARPDHPIGLWYRAQCLVRLDQRGLADADFQRCLEVAPNPTPELVLARAANLEKAGDAAKALVVIDAGIERLGPISSLQLGAAELEVRLGRSADAIARMDRLIAESARKEALLFHKGRLQEEAGNPVAAREGYLAAQAAFETLSPTTRKTVNNRALAEKIENALNRLNSAPGGAAVGGR